MIGIVGHVDRLTRVEALADTVGADYVSVDDGTLGCEGNHRKVRARLAQSDDDWSIVLEDDAVPCDDFIAQLDQVLAVAPTPIVGLYLGRSNPPAWQGFIGHIQHDPAHWAICSHLLHGVGTAIHTDLVPDMLGHIHGMAYPIDDAITDWARAKHLMVGYTRPSLVDHADEPTLIASRYDGGRRDQPRTAWAHGTRACWNRTTVSLP